MIKATEELRRLGGILDPSCPSSSSSSSSEAGDQQHRPRGRSPLRQQVLVQREVVDDFERELRHANRAIRHHPRSVDPSEQRSGEAYNEEIRRVLRTCHDPVQRYTTFRQMLLSLQEPADRPGTGETAHQERVRQLKLAIGDIKFDLADLERLKNTGEEDAPNNVPWLEARGHSSQSQAQHGDGGGSGAGSRPSGAPSRGRRTVIRIRPL